MAEGNRQSEIGNRQCARPSPELAPLVRPLPCLRREGLKKGPDQISEKPQLMNRQEILPHPSGLSLEPRNERKTRKEMRFLIFACFVFFAVEKF